MNPTFSKILDDMARDFVRDMKRAAIESRTTYKDAAGNMVGDIREYNPIIEIDDMAWSAGR